MNIQDKIAKLLALSESPVEAEARAALLKARELMAKHKVDISDVCIDKDEKIVKVLTGYTATTERNSWMFSLASVISNNYCCRAVRRHTNKHSKTYDILFSGFESDAAICKEAFQYAAEFVERKADEIRKQHIGTHHWRSIERYVNTYGLAFVDGMELAFNEQNNLNEVGMILIVPKAVDEWLMAHNTQHAQIKISVNKDDISDELEKKGHEDGYNFKARKRLAEPVQM